VTFSRKYQFFKLFIYITYLLIIYSLLFVTDDAIASGFFIYFLYFYIFVFYIFFLFSFFTHTHTHTRARTHTHFVKPKYILIKNNICGACCDV